MDENNESVVTLKDMFVILNEVVDIQTKGYEDAIDKLLNLMVKCEDEKVNEKIRESISMIDSILSVAVLAKIPGAKVDELIDQFVAEAKTHIR